MTTLETVDREITGLFKDVTQVMWDRLTPILGITMTQHLFGQAVIENLEQFAWLNAVQFSQEGPGFGEFDGTSRPYNEIEIRRGLAAIVKTVLDTLTILTGDLLTSDMPANVMDFAKGASVRGAQMVATSPVQSEVTKAPSRR